MWSLLIVCLTRIGILLFHTINVSVEYPTTIVFLSSKLHFQRINSLFIKTNKQWQFHPDQILFQFLFVYLFRRIHYKMGIIKFACIFCWRRCHVLLTAIRLCYCWNLVHVSGFQSGHWPYLKEWIFCFVSAACRRFQRTNTAL